MNQLSVIFVHGPHAAYLLGSYGAVFVVLVANLVLPLLRRRKLRDEIRHEIAQRGTRK